MKYNKRREDGERDMNYTYRNDVRENDAIRDSFNALTRKVYYFDFADWYAKGHWTERYEPHVLMDGDKVISNVSVNRMTMDDRGTIRNYLQIGTVMTDPDYRGQGLNQRVFEEVLKEYQGKVDGIYLFANDSVLDYYPRYGFEARDEYEYSFVADDKVLAYDVRKVNLANEKEQDNVYNAVVQCDENNRGVNPNEAFAMCDNLGLYQFWLAAEYDENVYEIPELDAYVIVTKEENELFIHQLISTKEVDLQRLARAFDASGRVRLGYIPVNTEGMEVSIRKEEDCTLFVMGESLKKISDNKMMFPLISHA